MAQAGEDKEKVLKQLRQTLDSDPNNPSHHYDLGLLLWNRGDESEGEESKRLREKAAEHFLASAKLNPNDGGAFRFLGHYYSRVAVDAQRASKCYQRAASVNPDDAEAGEGLCDLLDKEAKESLEVAVCKEASDKSPRAFWAFRRLGFLQLHQGKWAEAVPSLQHAIRGYPSCADLWEALGVAYQRLGMLTASIKSYGRAIELEGSRIFALIESGNIHLLLGSFRTGVEQFQCALEIAPNNLSAKFGLASGLLGWARDCANSGAFSWAASLLEEASEAAKSCMSLAGNLFSAWKLLGDIQMAYAKCYPWEEEEEKRGGDIIINEEKFRVSVSKWRSKCVSAARSARRAYQRAIHLSPSQANLYSDLAVSLHLLSLQDNSNNKPDPDINSAAVWEIDEKMTLGALMLEPYNKELWVILGQVSGKAALKQHCLVRALHFDVSLPQAWALLGKLYWDLGGRELGRQAFDRARSIDPSLALPWAGMSVHHQSGDGLIDESFESCLRAVQILPLAEFQVGLGMVAAYSGHAQSPQVLGAIRQAVHQAPFSPECHNIKGLVCEARSDYAAAIASYRRARFTLNITKSDSNSDIIKSRLADVTVNLARSLCKAGLANEAAHECEDLKREGVLDTRELQIYAIALWKAGEHDSALSVGRSLAGKVTSMEQTEAAAAVGLITKLVYTISGLHSSASLIQKIPRPLLQSTHLTLILSALKALLQPAKQLHELPQLNTSSYDLSSELHAILALGNLMSGEADHQKGVDTAVNDLRKALHMYPNSSLIRNQIGALLLTTGDWTASNKASKCTSLVIKGREASRKALKSGHEIEGSSVVACYASSPSIPKFSFPSCIPHMMDAHADILPLNRWLHLEPWNRDARYMLVLSLLQKAREERCPEQQCAALKRLITSSLSSYYHEPYSWSSLESKQWNYQKFILLLCASEISLHMGDYGTCISHSTDALGLASPSHMIEPFFAHLQLCRVYAIQGKLSHLKKEYDNCLQTGTKSEIGWVLLKYIESWLRPLEISSTNIIEMKLQDCMKGNGSGSSNIWGALFYLACAQCFLWEKDYFGAEQALAQACILYAGQNNCSLLLLCHGAICMEIARQQEDAEYIGRGVSSLRKAQQASPYPLPIVSLLLAQGEASLSLASKSKWERLLRLDWSSWPPEMRPAELYFQMHLLAKQTSAAASQKHAGGAELMQSPERWVLRAIHLNPSCMRYWTVLLKLTQADL